MGFVLLSRDREDKHIQNENKRSTCYHSITISWHGNLRYCCCSINTSSLKISYKGTTEKMHISLLVNSHMNMGQKAAEISERQWKLSRCPKRAQGPRWGSLVWLCPSSAAIARAFQGDAGGLGITPGGQLSTSHLAQPWLRRGNEQADKMNPSLPPEGGYFWSVLSNICRLEQGGTQAAQEKACTAVTKLQIKLNTAVS